MRLQRCAATVFGLRYCGTNFVVFVVLNMLASLKRPAPNKPQDAAERRCKPRATGTEAALAAFRSAARSHLPLVLGLTLVPP